MNTYLKRIILTIPSAFQFEVVKMQSYTICAIYMDDINTIAVVIIVARVIGRRDDTRWGIPGPPTTWKDVIWVLWWLKSPSFRLFIQQIVQATNRKKTNDFCITGIFWGEPLEFLSQRGPALRCVLPCMTSSWNRGSECKSLSLPGPFSLRKFGVNIHVDANAFQTWLPSGTTTDN